MSAPLRILVYGSLDAGVSDLYRFGQFRAPLADHDVELRAWDEVGDHLVEMPAIPGLDPDEAIALGLARIDLTPLAWADVLVFRRWYAASFACGTCDTAAPDEPSVVRHAVATGHPVGPPDRHLAVLLAALRDRAERPPGLAVVYDTDDDLLAAPAWTGLANRLAPARAQIEWLLREADLVTVSTPVLAAVAARFNGHVRVVRNALDAAWYARPDRHGRAEDGDVRVIYHGVERRLRDYAVARPAVDAVAATRARVRRVWLGSDDPAVGAVVDEAHPFVAGPPAFARALVGARPDVGLAPLVDEPYGRARSELHWLEYSLAGAATIATQTHEPGPYDVVRDGVDGLLARDATAWRHGLERLVDSAELRADLAGRAGERVRREYSVCARAGEWADAYRQAVGRVRRPTSAASRPVRRPTPAAS